MAIPSSGELRLNGDINLEINGTGTGTNVSLNGLSISAGFTAPDGMKEFYGYANATAPSVTTNSATSVTTSSMVANGNVTSDGGGTITERGFYFGTNSASPTNNTKYTVSGTTGSFSRTFTGLPSNSTRYYWAYAKNSAGTTYGARITQLTAYPYTFSSTTNHYMTAPSSSARARRYYQDISGSWTLLSTLTPNQQKCVKHSTNRNNRYYLTGGDDTDWSSAWFRINLAQNGCGSISSISNKVKTGDTSTSFSSTTASFTRFTTANFYYDVP